MRIENVHEHEETIVARGEPEPECVLDTIGRAEVPVGELVEATREAERACDVRGVRDERGGVELASRKQLGERRRGVVDRHREVAITGHTLGARK